MIDFYYERDLEDAGFDAFEFSIMDDDERRERLEEAYLDPILYEDTYLSSDFNAWQNLQDAGLSISELDAMDDDERRKALRAVGLDPRDYGIEPEASHHEQDPRSAPSAKPDNRSKPQPAREPITELGTASVLSTDESDVTESSYRFVTVRLLSEDKTYFCLTTDRSIGLGDRVIVPAGERNDPVLAVVVATGDYSEQPHVFQRHAHHGPAPR